MAKVSVWLTSYNHGSLLKKSIDSVLAQTYRDYELILIDDASSDNSQELIREYAKKDSRIKTILRSENVGHSAPYPYLDMLNGEYIAILHGDDYWLPEKLEKQVKVLDAHPEVSVCFTAARIVNEFDETDRIHKNPFLTSLPSRGALLRHFLDEGDCLCHPSALMRIRVYRDYDLNLEGYYGSDFYKWVMLALRSEFWLIAEELTCFRYYQSEKNMSGDRAENIYRFMFEDMILFKEFFSIRDPDLLLEIFPEARKFVREGSVHIPFAVAQMLLASPRPQIKLAGLEKLMELRRTPADREEIERRYGYDYKAFERDKQRYDLFGYVPGERFLECGLYPDYGDGCRDETRLRKRVYLPHSGSVHLRFALPEKAAGHKLKSLRFDPDEGFFRRIRIVSAQWENGENVRFRCVNAEEHINGTDVFYTTDPQYVLEEPAEHTAVHISMEVETIPLSEISAFFEKRRTDPERFLDCGLYPDYGEGYREETVLRQRIPFFPFNTIWIRFELPEEEKNRTLKSLRFDPDEGVLRKVRIDAMYWEDGSAIRYQCVNAEERLEGTDVFYTTDPQYVLEVEEGHSAVLIGMEAESFSKEELYALPTKIRQAAQLRKTPERRKLKGRREK